MRLDQEEGVAMAEVHPLGDGRGTYIDDDTIEGTFALGHDMEGFKMTLASVDETGYFLTIRWERVDEDISRS